MCAAKRFVRQNRAESIIQRVKVSDIVTFYGLLVSRSPSNLPHRVEAKLCYSYIELIELLNR